MKLNKVIVIGSGIGGLCAAAALSSVAKSVQIYCKDLRPETPSARKYAPQGNHISILLQAGLYNLETLFPNLHNELITSGSAEIRAGSGQQIHVNGEWIHNRPLDLVMLGQSRPFLEHAILKRVQKISSVSIQNNTKINSLILDGTKVSGVSGTTEKGDAFTDFADLVIDASGMSGQFSNQLVNSTEMTLDTEYMDIGIFYSTAFIKKPEKYLALKENISIIPEPGKSQIGAALVDIENDSWCVSLHGRDNATPPKDFKEWLKFSKELPDLRIWERVSEGELIGKIQTFKKPKALWRHFERSTNLPERYVPLGDTINSLNPIFGQGMTMAIGHAVELQKAFMTEASINDSIQLYLSKASNWTERAWNTTKNYDQKFLKADSMNTRQIELQKQLGERLHQLLENSEEDHLKFILQVQMLDLKN